MKTEKTQKARPNRVKKGRKKGGSGMIGGRNSCGFQKLDKITSHRRKDHSKEKPLECVRQEAAKANAPEGCPRLGVMSRKIVTTDEFYDGVVRQWEKTRKNLR